ncbi:hydrolase TatD [Kosmotoga arenicorallina S304]|uniref:Hydrolase TatD n=1 Tax=Kosmotoga arenicorallina S304 TaxID=1453497 RepID=A0A176JXL4_9BACT|nr:TatD family hydrolase [Kosmotoga arenicorallina]OAA28458.1 hydrolase TatD [Kosmotoga arenicorallina S304]
MTATSSISEQTLKLCDTHSHISFKQFDGDRDRIISQLKDGQIEFIIEVGIDLESSKRAVELATRFNRIFAAVGIHPHESAKALPEYLDDFRDLFANDTVVAIGEIGLDYFRNLSPKELQKKAFIEQLALAQELNLPVVVHIRDAYNDAYEILKKFGGGLRGVIHAFSGTKADAKNFIELGFKLGIGGPLTYPKNNELREIVRKFPLEYFLPETDCPYLPPQKYRGKRNEPLYVRFIEETIAEIKGISLIHCGAVLCENAVKLFRLKI